jgi:hypothetical protein
LGNAWCHSARNLLCSRQLSNKAKIKVYRTVILVSYFVWVWNFMSH